MTKSGNGTLHTSAPLGYRPEIDGLRAIAIIPVILDHAGFRIAPGGYLGVDVFFVISGFLITSILHRHITEGRMSFLTFYERRARRILPALFVVLVFSLIVGWLIMLPEDFRNFGQSVFATNVFLSNVFFARETGYFDSESALKPLLHTWSLSVEEQFYLIFPMIMVAIYAIRPRLAPLILTILFAVSIAVAQYGSIYFPQINFFSPFSRAWELLAGALAAYVHIERARISGRHQVYLGALSLLALSAIVLAYLLFDEHTPNPSLLTLIPVMGAVGVILFAVPGTLAHRLLSNRWVVLVGLTSYSAYLWHQPLFVFARLWFGAIPTLGWIGLIVLTLGLAWLSWKYVEAPFRDTAWLRQRTIFALAATGICLFAAAGLGLHITRGAGWRLDAQGRLLAAGQIDISPMRDSCGNVLPDTFDDYCIIGAAAPASAIVAYLGDSHGKEMFWRLSEKLKHDPGLTYRVQPFLWNACLPFASIETPGDSCNVFHARARDYILANPDIKIVVIGAAWQGHLDCEGSRTGRTALADCAFLDGAAKKMAEEIELYRQAGKKVIVVGPFPSMPWDVPRELQARRLRGQAWTDLAQRPVIDHEAMARFRTLESLVPDVRFYQPAAALCPAAQEGACLVSIDARPLYFDSNHISGHGADLVLPGLMAEIDHELAAIK